MTKFGIGYLGLKMILLAVATGLVSYNSLTSLVVVVSVLSIEMLVQFALGLCFASCYLCVLGMCGKI